MALVLAFSGLLIITIFGFALLQAARKKHLDLMLHSDPYRVWYDAQDFSLKSYRPVLKGVGLVLAGAGWAAGAVMAGMSEGVAYTLLVVLLGWLPAAALSAVCVAVLVLVLQAGRYVLFSVRWGVKVMRVEQVARSGGHKA